VLAVHLGEDLSFSLVMTIGAHGGGTVAFTAPAPSLALGRGIQRQRNVVELFSCWMYSADVRGYGPR